jgi:hypothetical protein
VPTSLRLCLPEVACGVWEAESGTRRVGLPPQSISSSPRTAATAGRDLVENDRDCSVSSSKSGHAAFRAPIRLRHGIGGLFQCPLSLQMLWADKTSVCFEPCPLHNMATQCCPYQSSARMLSRLHAVIDLEAAPWGLDHCYGASFPA